MSVSLDGFDPSSVPDSEYSGDFKTLPNGKYLVTLDKAESKVSTAGNAYINFQWRVADGQYANRVLFDMVMQSGKEIAVTIGKQKLKAICNACNVITPKSTDEFMSKLVCVEVGARNEDGELKNTIKKYLPSSEYDGKAPVASPKRFSQMSPGPSANPDDDPPF